MYGKIFCVEFQMTPLIEELISGFETASMSPIWWSTVVWGLSILITSTSTRTNIHVSYGLSTSTSPEIRYASASTASVST